MNISNFFNNSYQPSFFNSGQDPRQNSQNGFRCRLCNHVFPSYQALKAHFESHFTLENPAIRNLFSSSHANSQREMIPNPLQPNFPRPMVMQETRNFVNRNFQAPPQQPMVMPQYRANLFPCAIQHNVAASQPLQGPPEPQATQFVNNNVEMAQLLAPPAIHQMEMEVSPIDGTKPYIDLLDKPINNNWVFNQSFKGLFLNSVLLWVIYDVGGYKNYHIMYVFSLE